MIDKIISYLAAIGIIYIIKDIFFYLKNLKLKHDSRKIDLVICDKDNYKDIKAFIILLEKNPKTIKQINQYLIDEFGYQIVFNTKE